MSQSTPKLTEWGNRFGRFKVGRYQHGKYILLDLSEVPNDSRHPRKIVFEKTGTRYVYRYYIKWSDFVNCSCVGDLAFIPKSAMLFTKRRKSLTKNNCGGII